MQKNYKVKLTFPFDWPIMRQTPNYSGRWGNYEFLLNDTISECDFWVIFSDYQLAKEMAYCPPKNVIFMPSETATIQRFNDKFIKQFPKVITCQPEITGTNVSYNLGGHPWFVNKSYDELISMAPVQKTKKISIISSNKAWTDGHKKRLDFAYKLKDYFGDEIEMFGRGIRNFEDKWDTLAPFKYSIAIENDICDDWLTEKFYDCPLAFTYPIYYGCPNATKYFSERCFARIDIGDFNGSAKAIEQILNNPSHYDDHLADMQSERIKFLNNYNLFPLIVSYLENMDGNAARKEITVQPQVYRLSAKTKLSIL